MSITAVIKKPTLIRANTTSLTTTQSNPELTLRTTPVSQQYLHSLLDVVESNPASGDTLVYNSTTHKYEVKPVLANIDGGTF
jgi:hypothetical protein